MARARVRARSRVSVRVSVTVWVRARARVRVRPGTSRPSPGSRRLNTAFSTRAVTLPRAIRIRVR